MNGALHWVLYRREIVHSCETVYRHPIITPRALTRLFLRLKTRKRECADCGFEHERLVPADHGGLTITECSTVCEPMPRSATRLLLRLKARLRHGR